MRYHRFFTPLPLEDRQQFELPKAAAHHCIQVLRYKVGAQILLFNGDGFDYLAQIQQIQGKQCQILILDKQLPGNESPLKIHLFQGIARGEKMDFIIQKSIELGVNEITPIFTERSNVKLDEKRLNKKLEHWQSVADSACEQSGRALRVPIARPMNLAQIRDLTSQCNFYLEPCAKLKLADIQSLQSKSAQSISLFIGPEGGFSDSDLATLRQLEVSELNLGPRILRTETAGIACIAILQSHFGDL